jgi:hypothetical protein
MIAKTIIATAAIATTMALAAPIQQAEAKTSINIGVGIGGGYHHGYYPDYGYGYGYGYGYKKHISCWKGAKIVDWSGFHNVKAFDCSLPSYRYTAWKNGKKYVVRVNGKGHITNVHKI